MEESEFIWMNNEFVPWKEANIPALTKALHYGYAVFEGIRCYETSKGPALFRLQDHMKRLMNSAHIMQLKTPYKKEEYEKACIEIIRKNKLTQAYVRPLIYLGYGALGMDIKGVPVDSLVAGFKFKTYLGEEAVKHGVKIKTSSYRRHNVNSMMVKAKTSGNYPNSILAKMEALNSGFADALMLDQEGYVCECTAENVFMVKNNILVTPPLMSALEGITRDSIMQIARDEKISVEERLFTRDEMYTADEAFMTGTAAELTPIVNIDERIIGSGNPEHITKKLQKKYFDIVHGKVSKYKKWLTFVK